MVNRPLMKRCLSMKGRTLGAAERSRETGLQSVAHESLDRLTRLLGIGIRAPGSGKCT